MAFSAKTQYGLIALIDLAGAYGSDTLLQTGEISRRHNIPERYLEQMLTSLRKAGLLSSLRGPRGGFQLTQSPESISVADVVATLEGRARNDGQQGERNNPSFQVLLALERTVEAATATVLAAKTLAQLLQERDALRQPLPMFYI